LACNRFFPRRRELPRRRSGDHPSGHTFRCLKRPTLARRKRGSPLALRGRRNQVAASWPCFGWGLPKPFGHPKRCCALTAPFSPLPREGLRFFFALPAVPRIAVSNHPRCESDFPRNPGDPGSAATRHSTAAITYCVRWSIPRARHTYAMPQGPQARYLLGWPRNRSRPLRPRQSTATIWPRPPCCRGPHFQPDVPPDVSANPRARICKRRRLERALRCCYSRPVGADVCVRVACKRWVRSPRLRKGCTGCHRRLSGQPSAGLGVSRVPSCILHRDTHQRADSRVKTAPGRRLAPTADRSGRPMITIASAHVGYTTKTWP